MARRFRRRRPRVTWMFTNGTNVTGRELQADFVATPFTVQLNWDSTSDIVFETLPLNPFDMPVEAEPTINVGGPNPQFTLADIIGSEYVTKRIVGNCWGVATNTSNPNAQEAFNVILGIGVYVARADATNVNRPIGGDPTLQLGLEANSRSYNPLDAETQREPWMFRRLWMLSTRPPPVNALNTGLVLATSELAQHNLFPATTAGYHGLRTGPFFDIKSARRIRQDERLWLSVAGMAAPIRETPPAVPVDNLHITATFDLRILGALRKAKNRSNF